jgi:hypothetical protein
MLLYLYRSILAIILLAIGTCSYGLNNLTNKFSVGIQGAASLGLANYQAHFLQDDDPKFQDFDQSGNSAIGLFGVNIGYNHLTKNNIISLTLGFNQAMGQIKTLFYVNDSIPTDDDAIDLPQKTKLKQQYNVMISWKHLIAPKTYLLIGTGFSALKTNSSMSIVDIEDGGNLNNVTISQNTYQYGGILSAGAEYFITKHSTFGTTLSYFMYAPSTLKDFNEFYTAASGVANTDHLQKRKIQINILALVLNYSYYF